MAIHSPRIHAPGPHLDQSADQSGSGSQGLGSQNTLGNQALQDQVNGLTGRTFNRIIGAADGDTTTADQHFGKTELTSYIEEQLEFAKGEWFSGAKISGAADGILKELDLNGDGKVGWQEFQAFRSRMLATIAPGLSEGASAAEIQARASEVFHSLQSGGVDYAVLEDHTRDQLSPDKDHKDLIAQLGALLLLDAADLDEQSLSPRDRTLDEAEWMNLTDELAIESA